MKTLLLMRHAKSGWKKSKQPDKERSLTHRGEKDAEKMGELLQEKKLLPQVILTSTALRCRLTANTILNQCLGEITFKALDVLYMAETAAILDVLKSLDEKADEVLVIGHNPGLEGLLQNLSGEVESLPTASIAYFELPIHHWSELSLETTAKKWEKWQPKKA